MMEGEGDQDVFEITDFTTASDWERFIARIEEIIHEWNLSGPRKFSPLQKGEIVNGHWETRKDEVQFASYSFELTYHHLKPGEESTKEETTPTHQSWALSDMMSYENDFPHKAHCLVRWYGFREFAILTPAVAAESITTEDRAKLLLGSLVIALSNTLCQVPMFVQVQQPPHQFYLGVAEGLPGLRTHLDMVYLPQPPAGLSHLSGLLGLFKSRLGWPQMPLPSTSLAVRLTYVLNDWPMYPLPRNALEVDASKSLTPHTLASLPFGPLEEPIKEVHLYVTWPKIAEDCVHDNDIISNLDPIQAPVWALKLRSLESTACCMGDFLQEFIKLTGRSSRPLLSSPHQADTDTDSVAFNAPLERLAQRGTVLDLLLPGATGPASSRPTPQVLSESLLLTLLQFIFPDSAPAPLPDQEDSDDVWQDSSDLMFPKHEVKLLQQNSIPRGGSRQTCPLENLRPLKSAPVGSLTWRLALAVGHTYTRCGGLAALVELWQEVVQELRHRWEHNLTLPSLDPGHPNLTTCLIHQKLQLLNCCIERKKKREWKTSRPLHPESDDDEFFECNEDDSAQRQPAAVEVDKMVKQLGDLTLWDSDQPLLIPVTQEPAPMTEDMLDQHAEVLLQLGTHAEGAALRARMQSACLLSDMEAFKAANPNSGLCDFVRWYSPRDWVETDVADPDGGGVVKKGELSSRMQIPGNMWQENWDLARPVPAHRQKRLFDDTREAEKVLHFLSSLTGTGLVQYLMPILVHSALLTLADKAEEAPRDFPARWEQAAILASKASVSGKPFYKEVVARLSNCEAQLVQIRTLYQRLVLPTMTAEEKKSIWDFVLNLMEFQEASVPQAARGLIGGRIRHHFLQAQKEAQLILSEEDSRSHSTTSIREFPAPAGREFILRTCSPYPGLGSSPVAHRMHCVLTPACFRLAVALSEDTTYY